MNEEDLKNFKNLLSTGISTGMDIMLDYKFQKELLKKIKYYEKIERENKQLKEQVEYLRRSCERKEDTIISLENESIIDELEKWLVEKYFLWVPEIARGSKMMEVLKKINELKGEKING